MHMQQPPPPTTLRVVGRLAIAFLLDMVKVGRDGRDFLDSLVILAIIQANVARLMRDTELQRTYAAYDAPPPDELRRPVSVHAIAQSLGLPYETIRRHVAKQAALGMCELTPEGVIVSAAVLHSPRHKANLEAICELIRRFYLRLRALGALADLPPPDPAAAFTGREVPIRAVARVTSDYTLRIVETLTGHIGDLVRGFVWLSVLRANTEHLPDHEQGADNTAPQSFVPDELRRPVRIASVAERLEVPEETVRRHAARLADEGFLVRRREGLVVPSEVLARPNMIRIMAENHAHLRRMFASLALLGVLEAWEREAELVRP